jgi:hypothetical protein
MSIYLFIYNMLTQSYWTLYFFCYNAVMALQSNIHSTEHRFQALFLVHMTLFVWLASWTTVEQVHSVEKAK